MAPLTTNHKQAHSNKLKLPKLLEEKLFALYQSKTQDTQHQVQTHLAPLLRTLALQELKEGKSSLARNFRKQCRDTDINLTSFLTRQSHSGTWATYIELSALAEKLGFHLVVKDINQNRQEEYPLHRVENDDAPIMVITNHNNTHWSYNGHTIGDGNCGYNAIAKFLLAIKTPFYEKHLRTDNKASLHLSQSAPKTCQESSYEEVAIQQQQKIFEHYFPLIQKQPKPSELEQLSQLEEIRISQLPAAEQQQIQSDRALALKLAIDGTTFLPKDSTPCLKTLQDLQNDHFILSPAKLEG